MELQTLTEFFKWCTIINGGLYIWWLVWVMGMPEITYRLQRRFFALPRETYDAIIYGFLGCFKLIFVVFCLVPWLALLIVG